MRDPYGFALAGNTPAPCRPLASGGRLSARVRTHAAFRRCSACGYRKQRRSRHAYSVTRTDLPLRAIHLRRAVRSQAAAVFRRVCEPMRLSAAVPFVGTGHKEEAVTLYA